MTELEQAFRDQWGRVLAALVGYLGDCGCRRGVGAGGLRDSGGALAARRGPAEPVAWLITTARNRAINRIRRDRMLAEKTKLLDAQSRSRTRWVSGPSPTSGSS